MCSTRVAEKCPIQKFKRVLVGVSWTGVDVPVRRAAPSDALLTKLGSSRTRMEDTLQQQRAAYASLDQDYAPSDAQQRLATPRSRPHTDAVSAATSELSKCPTARHQSVHVHPVMFFPTLAHGQKLP